MQGPVKTLATAAVALLLVTEIARLTVAFAETDTRPALAMRLAPGIPPSLVAAAMADVGKAAAAGDNPSMETFELLRRISARAPLQPEPFLIEGALAERAGQLDRAAELLTNARWRDPRSIAALYLLSDTLIRQGKLAEGLGELAVLTQIMPESSVQLVPALSNYAKQPDARETLTRILEINPRLKQPLLVGLSADPANTDLIVALAGKGSAEQGAKIWQSRLIQGLINNGEYDRGYAVWRRFAGVANGSRPLLFNGDFRDLDAPPPFNWTYASSPAGFAEPAAGSLRVIYYGRNDAVLAQQLLLLAPGTYRFEALAEGTIPSRVLQWVVTCQRDGRTIMESPAGSGTLLFEVPDDCSAQILALRGVAQETSSDLDVRIGPVRIQSAMR